MIFRHRGRVLGVRAVRPVRRVGVPQPPVERPIYHAARKSRSWSTAPFAWFAEASRGPVAVGLLCSPPAGPARASRTRIFGPPEVPIDTGSSRACSGGATRSRMGVTLAGWCAPVKAGFPAQPTPRRSDSPATRSSAFEVRTPPETSSSPDTSDLLCGGRARLLLASEEGFAARSHEGPRGDLAALGGPPYPIRDPRGSPEGENVHLRASSRGPAAGVALTGIRIAIRETSRWPCNYRGGTMAPTRFRGQAVGRVRRVRRGVRKG